MKKIIYLHIKKEVKIGDTIIFNGMSIEVSDKLIKNNPDMFEVKNEEIPKYFKCISTYSNSDFTWHRIYKQAFSGNYPRELGIINDKGNQVSIPFWNNSYVGKSDSCFEPSNQEEFDKQKLLDKAKRYYPVGTKILSDGIIQKVIKDEFFFSPYKTGNIQVRTDIFPDGGNINIKGKWVEILPLKFISEDGVKIYGDMKTWVIDKDLKLRNHSDYDGAIPQYKYFYHKENALAYINYIKKHKEKTLEDYEDILLTSDFFMEYHWLKDNEPKLYYTKILQLIADDLNDVRYIHERGQASFHINKEGRVTLHMGDDEGAVYFKSKELVLKARDILGDKLECLFN